MYLSLFIGVEREYYTKSSTTHSNSYHALCTYHAFITVQDGRLATYAIREDKMHSTPSLGRFPDVFLNQFQFWSNWRWSFVVLPRNRQSSASSFSAPSPKAIDGMIFLSLWTKVIVQVPQHFKASESQAT